MELSGLPLHTDNRHGSEQPQLRLAFPVATILRLLESGALCAADFRCQDADLKSVVRKLCLACCAKNLIQSTRSFARDDEHAMRIPVAEPRMAAQTAPGWGKAGLGRLLVRTMG